MKDGVVPPFPGADVVGEMPDTLEQIQNQLPPVLCGLGEAAVQPLCPGAPGCEVGHNVQDSACRAFREGLN